MSAMLSGRWAMSRAGGSFRGRHWTGTNRQEEDRGAVSGLDDRAAWVDGVSAGTSG